MAPRFLLVSAVLALAPLAVHAAPAPELAVSPSLPASASPVTLQGFLQRMRQPAAPVAAPQAADAGFVPRTAHDNSPYRFDMTQNGRRMTADEFDAWMKARGIRVATGKPANTAQAEAAESSAAPAAAPCQASATVTC